MQNGLKQREERKGQGDWSPPPLIAEEGGRNVGNRKERHSWRNYAGSPDSHPPCGVWGKAPTSPTRSAMKKQSGSEANPDGELPQRLIPSPPPSCSPKRSPCKAKSGQHTLQPTKTGRPAKRAVCPFSVSSHVHEHLDAFFANNPGGIAHPIAYRRAAPGCTGDEPSHRPYVNSLRHRPGHKAAILQRFMDAPTAPILVTFQALAVLRE